MKTNMLLSDISDGQSYDLMDTVLADTKGCEGCSACCENVGDLVTLTPYDLYQMRVATGMTLDALFEGHLQKVTQDKITLPHLKMVTENQNCAFLDKDKRCAIHAYRPNICRLFPLGRFYENGDFHYFLQNNACIKEDLEPVVVNDWINIPNYDDNKIFILSWYQFIKALTFRMKFVRDEAEIEAIQKDILDTFFRLEAQDDLTFYATFQRELKKAKERLSLL